MSFKFGSQRVFEHYWVTMVYLKSLHLWTHLKPFITTFSIWGGFTEWELIYCTEYDLVGPEPFVHELDNNVFLFIFLFSLTYVLTFIEMNN